MGKKNIAYIVSFMNKSQVFEWTIELLDRNKLNYYFILLNNKDTLFEEYLKEKGFETYRINYSGKKDIVRAIREVYRILRKKKTDIVHAHLFDASLIGMLAAKLAGVKKRIYTRHHSTLHHEYHPQAVRYDKFINYLSTDIIAVSNTVKEVLVKKEGIKPDKVHVIHHGFRLDEFENVPSERVSKLREKYQLSNYAPVIGVASRYIHWKGIQYIIPAFNRFLQKYPNAHLVLASANGPYKTEIQELLHGLPVNSYTEIRFEPDMLALFKLFDIFVHVPIDATSEAFGQVYVEAFLSKVPCIYTLSGIACEFVENYKNALTVPYKDEESIYNKLIELWENKTLKELLVNNGYDVASKMFPVNVMAGIEQLYN